MSKGRYAKKKASSFPVLLLAIVLVAVVALIVFFVRGNNTESLPSEPENTTVEEAVNSNGSGSDNEMDPATETDGTANRENPSETVGTLNSENASETDGVTNRENASVTEDPENTEQSPMETQEPMVIVTQPPVVIEQRVDAEYEKWLAAAMVVCISMEYPDFELEGIYTASATALADKFDSDGTYIIFSSGGTRMALHSVPLEAERSTAGTKDISTEAMGYATFDPVDPASVDTSALIAIELEELGELIAQSLLVSIYAH